MTSLDFVFNISRGRVAEFCNRVKNNDPGTSQITVVLLDAVGLESDAVLIDKVTMADLVSGSTNEAVNGGYVRKNFTDADAITFAPDYVHDTTTADTPDITWAGVAAGNPIAKLVTLYNPAAGADSTLIPMTAHMFEQTPDGVTAITAVIAGFYKAS